VASSGDVVLRDGNNDIKTFRAPAEEDSHDYLIALSWRKYRTVTKLWRFILARPFGATPVTVADASVASWA